LNVRDQYTNNLPRMQEKTFIRAENMKKQGAIKLKKGVSFLNGF